MNDSLAITLAALAQRLGVHVEVLHQAALQQAPVAAAISILSLVVFVGISAVLIWFACVSVKKPEKKLQRRMYRSLRSACGSFRFDRDCYSNRFERGNDLRRSLQS